MREATRRIALVSTILVLFPAGSAAAGGQDAKNEALDPTIVRKKIEALGLRDDTLATRERPQIWLGQRREKLRPELIAGLDHKEARVAKGCLVVLENAKPDKDLADALIRIAGDPKHPISVPATLSLRRFAKDARAKALLEKALTDVERFADPQQRSKIAHALGRDAEAVGLLVPLLNRMKSDWDVIVLVGRLGEIGHASAVGPLETLTTDPRWRIAVAAYRALAKIDPAGHGLTKDQRAFLDEARGGKATHSTLQARWRELAGLKKTELRPLVLQMLASDHPRPALAILAEWKDTEALPEIKRLMVSNQGWRRQRFIAAYLEIDDSDRSISDVLSMAAGSRRQQDAEVVVRAMAQSRMPTPRKLAALRRLREEVGKWRPLLVPHGLMWLARDKQDIAPLLVPLMRKETDLMALAGYAQLAARDGKKRFGKEVRRAVAMAASTHKRSRTEALAAKTILDACASYALSDSGRLADRLLDAPEPVVRIAAAQVSARFGGDRKRALQVLYEALESSDASLRKQASACLSDIPCLDATERAAREKVLLSHLGRPSEDYALRGLATCGGSKTVEQLEPLLDADDIPRAVYAAWVLAQHPDGDVKERALRRLAVYAMFHHQAYQQGAGIDFKVARDLDFHQVTMRLNPGRNDGGSAASPRIPSRLRLPFTLDQKEQAFSIRAYRHILSERPSGCFPRLRSLWRPSGTWDASHLPLFRVAVREDTRLEVLHVKGKKVAHFPDRKSAAQEIAAITGAKASYIGLAGEAIDSEAAPPSPYPDQNALIARFLLDRLEAAGGLLKRPESGEAWQRHNVFESILNHLMDRERFGEGLRDALVAESRRRKLVGQLRDASFSPWRNLKE